MPICFVNIITLYLEGFEILDNFDEDELQALLELRENEVLGIMELQFVLAYQANVSKEDTDNMTPFELSNWFELLKKQKQVEYDQEKENNKR